jgi:sterol desaturase/sphingolipid hydroxylase (fatty acid hydroxylase superfamily)
MIESLLSVVQTVGAQVLRIMEILLGLGIVFAVLTHFWPCNPGRPWWRKRELITDLCYAFVIPLLNRYVALAFIGAGAVVLFGITTPDGMLDFYINGHGPLAQCPLWLQAAIYLVGADLWMYWVHRAFHRPEIWKYHAIHHSSTDLDWISATRFHPVNIALGGVMADVVMLLAGASPNALALVAPFNIAHSAFVHANLNWTLGPLRYVIAGPVFHRWHHTAADQGGSKNFAPTFPVLDVIFGTLHLPANSLPEGYGVSDEGFPAGIGGQMIYPFKT